MSPVERAVVKQAIIKQQGKEQKNLAELLGQAEGQLQEDEAKDIIRDDPTKGGYGSPGAGGSRITHVGIAEGGRIPLKDGSVVEKFIDMWQGFFGMQKLDDFATPAKAIEPFLPTEEQIRQQQRPDDVETPPEEGHSFVNDPNQTQFAEGPRLEYPYNPTSPIDTAPQLGPDQLQRLKEQGKFFPVRRAQVGGTIERDPQSSFLLPQSARQLAGVGLSANAYPTSPQEPFVGSNITGSVLANLPNASPAPIVAQPSFMGQQQQQQPQFQKKNSELSRYGFQNGTPKPLVNPARARRPDYAYREQFEVSEEEQDKIAAYEIAGGDVELWKTMKHGSRKEDYRIGKDGPKVYDGATQSFVVYNDGTKGNRTILGLNLDKSAKLGNPALEALDIGDTFNRHDVIRQQNLLIDKKADDEAEFSRTHGITNPQARRVIRDLFFNTIDNLNTMPGAKAALANKQWERAALELQFHSPDTDRNKETKYYRFGTNVNRRAQDNINILRNLSNQEQLAQEQLAQGFMPDTVEEEKSFLTA